MKIVPKTFYVADDGKEFPTEKDCVEYEKFSWFVNEWNKEVEDDVGHFYYVLDDINCNDGEEVLKYLLTFCNITPKKKKKQTKILNEKTK